MRQFGQHDVALSAVEDDNAACALASEDCDHSPPYLGQVPEEEAPFAKLSQDTNRSAL
jgi:hypothetical protein